MIKNVAIGTGVIVICVTISCTTAGTANAISAIFAMSASKAPIMAIKGTAIGAVTSGLVKYYETGDFEESFNAALIGASEGFKWGAIIGSVSGGSHEAIMQLKASKELKNMNFLERGARSEIRASQKYGGREQVSYLNGQEVPSSVSGATKPDLVRDINGKLEAIEVKNYNLNSEESRRYLLKELDRQITSRSINLPSGSTQRIVLDVQGRNYDKKLIKEVIEDIQRTCNHSYLNIPVDIMS